MQDVFVIQTTQLGKSLILNRVLCVFCWFVQGSIVMFLLKKCVLNYINGEPLFHRNGTFFELNCNGWLP